MADDLQQISDWLSPLLKNLGTSERRKLMQTVARELRRRNQQRIQRQTDPDGQPYPSRLRKQKGRIKRQAMFSKLRLARYLRLASTADAAAVQWAGQTARIASIHQYGKIARVSRNGPQHKYAERRLIGFASDDQDDVTDMILAHISQGQS
jgi:phage virion morphogenesis protein